MYWRMIVSMQITFHEMSHFCQQQPMNAFTREKGWSLAMETGTEASCTLMPNSLLRR